MADNKSVGRGALILALSNLICKALGIFFKIPLANMGGGEIMATYQIGMSVFTLGIMPFVSGLPLICARRIAGTGSKKEQISLRRGALIPALIYGGCVSIFLFFFADFAADFAGNREAALAVRAVSPGIFACCVSSVLRAVFQGRGEMLPFGLSQITESLLRLGAGIGIAVVLLPFGSCYAAAGALAGVCIGEWGALLLLLLFTRDKCRKITPSGTGQMFFQSFPLCIGAVIRSLSGVWENAVVLRRLPLSGMESAAAKAAFGIYSGYVMTLFSIPSTFVTALCGSLLSPFSRACTRENRKNLHTLAEKGLLTAATVTAPFFGLFIAGSSRILSVFFGRAGDVAIAEPLLRALAPGVILLGINSVLTSLLTAGGYTRPLAVFGVISCGLRIGICSVCAALPQIGVFVLPLTTLCGLTASFVFLTVFSLKKCLLSRLPVGAMARCLLTSVGAALLSGQITGKIAGSFGSLIWIFVTFILYFTAELLLKNACILLIFDKLTVKIKEIHRKLYIFAKNS